MTKSKKSASRETNVQFVKRIMEYGSPLRQAFVIEAISKYAKACAKEDAKVFDSPFLHGASWKQVAVEIEAMMVERFKH